MVSCDETLFLPPSVEVSSIGAELDEYESSIRSPARGEVG
jgi:hypothetical protein